MCWTIVDFGKFSGKGKSLPQILFQDPDWFFYCFEKGLFNNKGALAHEAHDLNKKARAIRIPQGPGENLEAEYLIHRPTGKFAGVDVVPAARPVHQGSSPAWRKRAFDMALPRMICKYDKLGNKLHIQALKFHLFGKENARLSKRRAEEFFGNSNNFVN